LLRQLILRSLLIALPFAVWFLWRAWARRTGREMGSTPYAWLFAAGALLVGTSLMASAIFHRDNREDRYVPGEVTADGRVTQGYLQPKAPK
jgi:hypothetical protein